MLIVNDANNSFELANVPRSNTANLLTFLQTDITLQCTDWVIANGNQQNYTTICNGANSSYGTNFTLTAG